MQPGLCVLGPGGVGSNKGQGVGVMCVNKTSHMCILKSGNGTS